MKKKIGIIICVLLLIVLLLPVPWEIDDGGTIVYDAILYEIEDVHRLNPDVNAEHKINNNFKKHHGRKN